MQFVFEPHDGERRGYVPPVYNLYDQLLIHARLTHHKEPEAKRVFEPGVPFDVDGTFEPDLLDFVLSHREFRRVTRDWMREHQPHQLAKEV